MNHPSIFGYGAGWMSMAGYLTSMAPHAATSTPLEAGFRVKLRFASINKSLTLTRLVPVDHRNDSVFIQSPRQSIQ